MLGAHAPGRRATSPRHQPNLRGLDWWDETVPLVLPFLDADAARAAQRELAFQQHVAASPPTPPAARADPCRPVPRQRHVRRPARPRKADRLLRLLLRRRRQLPVRHRGVPERLVHRPRPAAASPRTAPPPSSTPTPDVRPLDGAERRLLPALLRAGALRFWLSRLWDLHLPRDAALLKAHDPSHFERVLRPGASPCPWHPRQALARWPLQAARPVAAAPGPGLGARQLRAVHAPAARVLAAVPAVPRGRADADGAARGRRAGAAGADAAADAGLRHRDTGRPAGPAGACRPAVRALQAAAMRGGVRCCCGCACCTRR